jgi:hypothetical protein
MDRYKTFKGSILFLPWVRGWKLQRCSLCYVRNHFDARCKAPEVEVALNLAHLAKLLWQITCKARPGLNICPPWPKLEGELSNKIPGQPHQDTVIVRRHFRKHGMHILLVLLLKLF